MSLEAGKAYKAGDASKGKAAAAPQRPMSDAVKKEKKRTLQMRLQQRDTQVSTIIVGIVVITILFGLAITMIVLAGIFDNTDFYIVGAIFALGGVVFTVLFIITNCTPWIKDRRVHAQLDKELEELEGQAEAPTVLAPGQYDRQGTLILD